MDKQAIEADARAAATLGLSIKDACRWPFGSAEALHWIACYLLARKT